MPTLTRISASADNAGSFTKSFSTPYATIALDDASANYIPLHFIQPYVAGILPGWSIESPALKGTSEYGVVRAVSLTCTTTMSGTGAAGAGGVLTIQRYRSGSTTATIATLDFITGVDATALTPKTITLSTTLANIKVLFGDLLVGVWTQGSTGLALPLGIITVDLL